MLRRSQSILVLIDVALVCNVSATNLANVNPRLVGVRCKLLVNFLNPLLEVRNLLVEQSLIFLDLVRDVLQNHALRCFLQFDPLAQVVVIDMNQPLLTILKVVLVPQVLVGKCAPIVAVFIVVLLYLLKRFLCGG